MEVALYGGLTSIWWTASATALLPFLILLKYNKFFRDLWFSYIFTKCLEIVYKPKMLPLRKKAFDLLNEKISGRDVTKPFKVLEIGIGSGENFKFYPENSQLTALDMNVNFNSYLKQNQRKYPQIVHERTITAVAENMKSVDDCSMDLVISTYSLRASEKLPICYYVLCSVTSLNDALKEVKRVLKPGGKFLFLEHVCYPKSEWGFTIQKFTSPLWSIYCDGCCLLRNTGDVIKNFGFSDVVCKKMYPQTMMLYVRPHVYGLAIK